MKFKFLALGLMLFSVSNGQTTSSSFSNVFVNSGLLVSRSIEPGPGTLSVDEQHLANRIFTSASGQLGICDNGDTVYFRINPSFFANVPSETNSIKPDNVIGTSALDTLTNSTTFTSQILYSPNSKLSFCDKCDVNSQKTYGEQIKFVSIDQLGGTALTLDSTQMFQISGFAGSLNGVQNIAITDANLLNEHLIAVGDQILTEQHSVNQFTFSRSDYSAWLRGSSTITPQGLSSLSILTASSQFPNAVNGIISIDQGHGRTFGISADSTGGIVGWTGILKDVLWLNATVVNTNANFIDNSLIESKGGIIVSNENLQTLTMPSSNISEYLVSNDTKGNGILIEDRETGEEGFAGIFLKQNGTTNSIATMSSNSTSAFKTPGTFVIESSSCNGILLNTVDRNNSIFGPIRFAINSQEVARFDEQGTLLIGTHSSEESSIVTVVSTEKGVIFPKMSSRQRRHIKNPALGLEVFDTDLRKKCVYTGDCWEIIITKPIKENYSYYQ